MKTGKNIDLIQRHLDVAIAQSEFKRIKLFLGILILGFLLMCFNLFVVKNTTVFFTNSFTKYSIVAWFLVFIAYEALAAVMANRFLKKKIVVPIWLKVANVVFEAAMPSFLLILLCSLEFSAIFLDSPLLFFYLIIIVTSSLHLDVKLTLATGLVSSIGYLVVTVWAISSFDAEQQELNFPMILYVARGIFMLFISMAAVFVAQEFKNREVNMFGLLTDKRQIQSLLTQQVSLEVADTIISDNFSSKKHAVTILFLDVRDFSAFAEGHSPTEVNAFQNDLLGPMISIVRQNGGFVNQIMGDGIMATFGVRETDLDHSANALNASILMLKKVDQLVLKNTLPATKIGIGIHRGDVILGNIGNQFRKQFSVSGNTVNIAARLEQLNKVYQSELIISEAVLEHVEANNVEFVELGEVQIRNIEKRIVLYKLHRHQSQ